MPKASHVLIAAAAGLSIGMLPLQLGPSPLGGAVAYANNGKGNGGGSGGGDNGGGSGGGNGGAGGNSADHRNDGTGSQATAGQSSGDVNSEGGLLRALLRGGGKASTPEVAVVPADEKEKNLHAQARGLNSLQRNVHAYLNSNSPKLAPFRDYVVARAEAELAAEALVAAQDTLQAALDAFVELGGDADSIPIDDLAALQGRLATDTSGFTELQLAEQAAIQAAIDLLEAEAAATTAATPTALDLQTLIAAENTGLVVDTDLVNWANEILEGKVVEMKELLASQ